MIFILDHRRNIESHIKKLTEEKLKLETDSQNLRIEVDTHIHVVHRSSYIHTCT